MMTIHEALAFIDSEAKKARAYAEAADNSKGQSFAYKAVAMALEETAEIIRGEVREEGKENG